MKRLNIYGAFTALSGPGTKEDVIIQVAKQQNIRFNDLPLLQKEVDQALEESQRLGFVDREGAIYKLNMDEPSSSATNNKAIKEVEQQPRTSSPLNGEGDEKRQNSDPDANNQAKPCGSSCSGCSNLDAKKKKISTYDKHGLRKDKSVCSICGLSSESPMTIQEATGDDRSWTVTSAL